MGVREQFEERVEQQRREFNACLANERWEWWSQFTPLGRVIIEAAIDHFNRQPFSEWEMANYLLNTGKWPHGGRYRETPERTVNVYCHKTKYVGWLFESLGGARFRIKDKYPPEPTGLHSRNYDFRTDPDRERNELPCGCLVFLEPNLTISFIYCDMHAEIMKDVEKKSRLAVV